MPKALRDEDDLFVEAVEKIQKILSRRFSDAWYSGIRQRVLWFAKRVLRGAVEPEIFEELRGYLSDAEMAVVEEVKAVVVKTLGENT
jgi:hypothetical protein